MTWPEPAGSPSPRRRASQVGPSSAGLALWMLASVGALTYFRAVAGLTFSGRSAAARVPRG
jgi:hypothetical protein